MNNTDRDKDHTGHRHRYTSKDIIDDGVRMQTTHTVPWHAEQIPDASVQEGTKGAKGTESMRE